MNAAELKKQARTILRRTARQFSDKKELKDERIKTTIEWAIDDLKDLIGGEIEGDE